MVTTLQVGETDKEQKDSSQEGRGVQRVDVPFTEAEAGMKPGHL